MTVEAGSNERGGGAVMRVGVLNGFHLTPRSTLKIFSSDRQSKDLDPVFQTWLQTLIQPVIVLHERKQQPRAYGAL